MNCSAFESLVALYVEGDLRASEQKRVEAHLEICERCGDLVNDLRESQSLFKSLRQGTVNVAALANVRQRVIDEVGGLDPAPAWVIAMHRLFFAGLRRKTAIAGIALAVLVGGGVWFQQTRPAPQQPGERVIEVANFEAPSVPVAEPVASLPSPFAVAPRNSSVMDQREIVFFESSPEEIAAEPIIPEEKKLAQIPMRFVTDNPDIIIYWLPSDKGD